MRDPSSSADDATRATRLSRRRFLTLAGGGVVAVTFAGCSGSGGSDARAGPATASSGAPPTTTRTGATTATDATGAATSTATSTATTGAATIGERVLVIVQLNGGNDGLNTLVPLDGRYRDARPTLGIPEADLLALTGATDRAWHPALAPLLPLWDSGRMAVVEAVGFPDPNRSHFVALDRWWRADEPSATAGWLGAALDGVGPEPEPLTAVALGAGAPLLNGERRQPTVILSPQSFRFADRLDLDALRLLTDGPTTDPLVAAARAATGRSLDAVAAFASLLAADDATTGDDVGPREGGATIAAGLDVAGRLVTGGLGTRIVVVSAGGFDTHANQAATQQQLLADLATGVASFMAHVDGAGLGDQVLLMTTSEFGRRVHENASGGTDHGAGGLSFLVGPVVTGVHGSVDLGNLLDGDVRPTVDPRVLYTACLDWIGVDPVTVLDRRWDDVVLLRR